jgi:hypothetical protein
MEISFYLKLNTDFVPFCMLLSAKCMYVCMYVCFIFEISLAGAKSREQKLCGYDETL